MSDELEPETPVETLSINFNVEDGTCVLDANSYISLEEANQYQTNKNRQDWLALSDEEKKASLITGTQYIDKLYHWKGRRKYENQELGFPRVMIRDRDGFEVRGIPKKVKEAVCEAAYYGFIAKSELFTVFSTDTGSLKREKNVVTGAVEKETEYFENATKQADEYISKYASLNSILRGLYIEENDSKVNARVMWRG